MDSPGRRTFIQLFDFVGKKSRSQTRNEANIISNRHFLAERNTTRNQERKIVVVSDCNFFRPRGTKKL